MKARYLVADLSPEARSELRMSRPRLVFVAESPHISEVESDEAAGRRPLCGAAGRQWWSLLGELLEGEASADVTLKRQLELCGQHDIAVMNAIQYPLDPKVMRLFPDADPLKLVGFSKAPGPDFYKKRKNTPEMKQALDSLRARLNHPSVAEAPIHCLGNDAEWFVLQALGERAGERVKDKLPHPSAWWRRGGFFGRVAREKLGALLSSSRC